MTQAGVRARPPARVALREATREVHERLHNVPVFAALAAGTLARDAYVALLGRLFGFHSSMEAALTQALLAAPYGMDPNGWRRAHLLREDLTSMGVKEAAIASLPCFPVPPVMTEASAMGCLYVVEGSTLGGRQLARKLDDIVPNGGEAGRRFLLGSTQPGHVRWAAVCAALDACGIDPARQAEMTTSAIRAFRQFEAWFGPRVKPQQPGSVTYQ